MKRWIHIFCLGALCGCLWPASAQSGHVEAQFHREAEAPQLTLVVTSDADLPAEATVMRISLSIEDLRSKERPWQTTIEVPVAGPPPWRAEFSLAEGMPESNARYRMALRARHNVLGIEYSEDLTVEHPGATINVYGLRKNGWFPDDTVHFVCGIAGTRAETLRELPVELQVTDADGNLILDTMIAVQPEREFSWHALEVTPYGPDLPCGPFNADARIESAAYGLAFRTSFSFARSNAVVPFSAMEDGRPSIWFTGRQLPGHAWENSRRQLGTRQSRAQHPMPHLTELAAHSEPWINFDETESMAGTRSLRVDYIAGEAAYVWARRPLPGKPLFMTMWVKGNNSGDRLYVTFEDMINYRLSPGWTRQADFSTEFICTLDFEDWRFFRVPVLGHGQQIESFAGSSEDIDAPISINVFRIEPAERRSNDAPHERRSLWIDLLAAETQVRPDERVSMELRADDPDGRLHAAERLTVSVGNGWPDALRRGRLSLTARDGLGEPVYSVQQEIEVPPNGVTVTHIPLAPLAALGPRGPVVVDVTFIDPSVSGARVASSWVFKAPQHGGVFLDFEESTIYSGYEPGNVVTSQSWIAQSDDGAVLEIPFAGETSGSALLHPSLPGIPASVVFHVRARGAGATLQAWLVDDGYTGVADRNYNLFWSDPLELEADGEWREWTFSAPPIPANYDDEDRSFLFEPRYPLDLAVRASATESGATGTVQIARIDVQTHLGDEQAFDVQIVRPDDTGLHAPGSPLSVVLRNYGSEPQRGSLGYTLHNSQERLVAEEWREIEVAAGEKRQVTLADRLDQGIYRLALHPFDSELRIETVSAVDAVSMFGNEPLASLRDPTGLRRRMGLKQENLYLDWDNSEPAPGGYEFEWFVRESARAARGERLNVVPVLGFSAEWAGPESSEAVARGDYFRSTANLYQTPVRAIDWELFVHEALWEFGGRFDQYVFWENPDRADSPQHIPPERYASLLNPLYRWARVFAPDAKVTAGGFNYDRALPYLDSVPDAAELMFDRISVQMNIGELSPEAADIEGFFDELDALLNVRSRGREIEATQLDWGIGPFLSPIDHAAFHARALMLLDSRDARRHSFGLVNSGFTFDGYGIFYRIPFGNNTVLQNLRPYYLPKPAFFALEHMTAFIDSQQFVGSVDLPDLSHDRNRVFLYKGADERLSAVFWRTLPGHHRFHRPAAWADTPMRDAFGFDVEKDAETLEVTPLPYIMLLPERETFESAVYTLRHLPDVEGEFPVLLDLYITEPDSARRADYQSSGETVDETVYGRLPGRPRRRQATIRRRVDAEQFTFESERGGDAIVTRRWFYESGGQRLYLSLNGGPEQSWDLVSERDDAPGLRESTYVLRGVRSGVNKVSVRYETPGNSSGYRIEPLSDETDWVALSRWGMLHALQTRGDMLLHQSTVGTPLRIGAETYETGIGAHASSLIELPLDGHFKALEVTVGVDAHTEGRGSVRFRIFVDEREMANSGVMSGLSAPVTLRVEGLESARRLLLSIDDADDGDTNDLANWVDGKLMLK